MGKKFINKNKCRIFKLVHPSNSQEKIAFKDITHEHHKASASDSLTEELERICLLDRPIDHETHETVSSYSYQEARRYGIEFDDIDDYDYLQHMQPIVPDGGFFDNPLYLQRLKEEDFEQKSNEDVIEVLRELESLDSDSTNDGPAIPQHAVSCANVLSRLLRTDREVEVLPCMADSSTIMEPCEGSPLFVSSLVQEREFDKVLAEYSNCEDDFNQVDDREDVHVHLRNTSAVKCGADGYICMEDLLEDIEKIFIAHGGDSFGRLADPLHSYLINFCGTIISNCAYFWFESLSSLSFKWSTSSSLVREAYFSNVTMLVAWDAN